MIPDGPLHPDDAFVALQAGMLIAAVVGRTRWLGPVLVGGWLLVLELRQPALVPEGLLDRPAPVVAAGAAIAVASVLAVALHLPAKASPRASLIVAAVGCGGAWATAPDTEPALIAGVMVVAAAAIVGSSVRGSAGIVVVAPTFAAAIGTVGRPDRLPLVLGVTATAMVAMRGVQLVAFAERRRRQRAGTPTTVAPAATSVVTTAPAPTTAP